MWRKPPVHPVLKVYVYNVTNADEFLEVLAPGEERVKPVLDELGPYVYMWVSQQRQRPGINSLKVEIKLKTLSWR